MGEIGVRYPVASLVQLQLHCHCECNGSSEITIINGCSVSQKVCHAKKNPHCSMTTRAEYRSKFGDITGNGYVSI